MAASAAAAAGAQAAASATACELVLTEHRSGRELQRLPLSAAAPQARIAFEHSVLGTTVTDHYVFTPQAQLIEERFSGEGYGLAHSAAPGERLLRDGAGWRLQLNRAVQPLVVRPLPAQRMRLIHAEGELLLSKLSDMAIEITAQGCSASGAAT